MMDDYDLQHSSKFKGIINFYCDNYQEGLEKYYQIDENNSIKNIINNTICINEKYYNEFCERVIQTIYKLKNGLSILDNREITNLGARVHCANPDNYDPDLGNRVDWYLVQVWRGSGPKN